MGCISWINWHHFMPKIKMAPLPLSLNISLCQFELSIEHWRSFIHPRNFTSNGHINQVVWTCIGHTCSTTHYLELHGILECCSSERAQRNFGRKKHKSKLLWINTMELVVGGYHYDRWSDKAGFFCNPQPPPPDLLNIIEIKLGRKGTIMTGKRLN